RPFPCEEPAAQARRLLAPRGARAAVSGSRLGREAVERRVYEARQGPEVVAALEDGCDPVAERPAALRELAEAVPAQAHVPERVVDVGVEAGRNEDELRLEARHCRLDDAGKCLQILLVP